MEKILWLSPLLAVAALLFAAWKAHFVASAAPGNTRMQEIAASIAEGADAFLKAEYRILAIFVAVLFVLIGLFINWAPSSPASSACASPRGPMSARPTPRWSPA